MHLDYGLVSLGSPSALNCMMVGAGGRTFGRTFARSVGLRSNFNGAGAHPWILVRRGGLARGIYNRLAADDPCSGHQTPSIAQGRFNTLISGSGYSATPVAPTRWLQPGGSNPAASGLVVGSNPVDPFGWGKGGEDLQFA